jgi:hypothetical protein
MSRIDVKPSWGIAALEFTAEGRRPPATRANGDFARPLPIHQPKRLKAAQERPKGLPEGVVLVTCEASRLVAGEDGQAAGGPVE